MQRAPWNGRDYDPPRHRGAYDRVVQTSARSIHGQYQRDRWRASIRAVVHPHAQGVRVGEACTNEQGYSRFLLSNIGIGQIENARHALDDAFGDGCFHDFVTTHADTGAVARDVDDVLFVDVLDPDALDSASAPSAFWCSLPVLAFVAGLAVFLWCASHLVKHYEGYRNPFVHHLAAAQTMWNTRS
jgi:hypothetical protein